MPKSGGHVGFIDFNKKNIYWSEKRAIQFLYDHNSNDIKEL
jgi:predicted alpha/beta-fold hydrolase